MKFAEIIREAGFNPKHYPTCSQLSITLYDRKLHEHTAESVHFAEPLFQGNPMAYKKFQLYLDRLEEELSSTETAIHSMSVQVTETMVIIRNGIPYPHYFARIASC